MYSSNKKMNQKIFEHVYENIELPTNYLLQQLRSKQYATNLWRLMQLLYFADGWYLGTFDKKLFDDPILTHPSGAFICSIYHTFKHYGGLPITGDAHLYDMQSMTPNVSTIPDDDTYTKQVLNAVVEELGDMPSEQLAIAAKGDGNDYCSPWRKTVLEFGYKTMIQPKYMRDFFINR